ncbi:MAG TPA: aminotransferase class I/II-fold pyridoxal phosphate-dependent enzyme [Terriglobales bacterium]|nr:aminotransferase class I/II-fold pyridoxal phosphate-dependent enzyme [Terriglobales bacterium]
MPLSRRDFFRTSLSAGAAAAALTLPTELFAGQEPSRAPSPGGPILLNSNENPYGPWPSLIDAMKTAARHAHRYPDDAHGPLIERIAALHRVSPEQVVIGCGSGEILRICGECFTSPELGLVTAAPTFEALARYASMRNHPVRKLPLNSLFEHDLPAMAASSKGKDGLVFICNPNNPTASITPRKKIDEYLSTLRGKEMVLIDEAYHHFSLNASDYTSYLDKPVNNDRVIVSRTFSKIYGLAGLRVGYAIAAPEVARRMRQSALPDGVNIIAAMCANFALTDLPGLASAIKRNEVDRADFQAELAKRGLKAIPSQGNFVMMETGRPIREVIAHFRQNNVAIGRPFPPLETHARISLGTPEEMKVFWKTWDKMTVA